MSPSSLLKSAVEDLSHAFEEFKDAQNQRLANLEKNRSDPLVEDKLARLTTWMDTIQTRLQKADISQRPALASTPFSAHDTEHKRVFLEYLRKGHEQELSLLEKKAWGHGEEGGFFLPGMLAAEVYASLQTRSVMRSVSSVIAISRHQYEVLMEHEPCAVQWQSPDKEEVLGQGLTPSPKLKRMVFPVHTMFSRQQISQTLLEDSHIDAGQWMVELITKRMLQAENHAFLLGKGDSSPKGILGGEYEFSEEATPDKIQIIKSGRCGQLSEQHPDENLIELLYTLKSEYLPGATWIVSRSAMAAIRSLKTPDGHPMWQPTMGADFSKSSLLGYPLLISDDMPTLKRGENSVPILFGNFREGYQIVDRTGITVQRDPYSAKPYIELYMTMRVGAGIKNFEAIKGLSLSE